MLVEFAKPVGLASEAGFGEIAAAGKARIAGKIDSLATVPILMGRKCRKYCY
jgi:hypothetical protein